MSITKLPVTEKAVEARVYYINEKLKRLDKPAIELGTWPVIATLKTHTKEEVYIFLEGFEDAIDYLIDSQLDHY